MMMTIIFLWLVVLLGSLMVIRLKRQNRQATPRRHLREPRVSDVSVVEASHEDILDSDEALGLSRKEPKTVAIPSEQSSSLMTEEPVSMDYISLHLMATRDCPYNGYELLQALLANGLRYGDKNIFHRYETKTGHSRILFSLASVNKPGTFELSKMGSFSCPGLTLFMIVKDLPNSLQAFDIMLETAKQLVEDLGGEVQDETRQLVDDDKIEYIRARFKKSEMGQHTPDLFEELQTE